jgi:hypothetical protein
LLLDYPRPEARGLLENAALASGPRERGRADLLAALMSDAVGEEDGGAGPGAVGPSPLCLLKGQGHQCFLETLAAVATRAAPATGGRRAARAAPSATACLDAALFRPWRRQDPARQATFRWDPADAARQAYLAGDPTDPKYQQGTEFGANRLAAAGLATLTVVPQRHRDRLVPCIPGGAWEDGFSFAWPIWTEPATLPAILALLNHPQLRVPGALAHLGVAHVFCAKRISVLRFLNLTPGRVLTGQGSAAPGA